MRLRVYLDVVYEVEGTLPDPTDEDATTAFLEHLMAAGGDMAETLDVDEGGYRMEPVGWRIEVDGYGDLTVGPKAFEEVS